MTFLSLNSKAVLMCFSIFYIYCYLLHPGWSCPIVASNRPGRQCSVILLCHRHGPIHAQWPIDTVLASFSMTACISAVCTVMDLLLVVGCSWTNMWHHYYCVIHPRTTLHRCWSPADVSLSTLSTLHLHLRSHLLS